MHLASLRVAGGCFTIVSRALQNILSKFVYCRNRTSYENFQLKLCVCAQSLALEAWGTRTKFQLEILTTNMISGIVYSRNVSETTPWFPPTLPPLPSPHKGTGKQSSETKEYKLLHGPRVTTEVAQQPGNGANGASLDCFTLLLARHRSGVYVKHEAYYSECETD